MRLILVLLLIAGCSDYPDERAAAARHLTGGDPDRGVHAVRRHGCGTCHLIPGIPGAVATVGPPLEHLRDRSYLAGHLANNPRNLIRWIRAPQSIDPRSAMPDMNVSERDARDIAAYLYALK
ncbi:MAG TPA: cytochrome C [Thermoanaerobaculia bacterium]|jgi:cytochrome c1